MRPEYRTALDTLARMGWHVETPSARQQLPSDILSRYSWIPSDFREVAEGASRICSPDGTAWVLTAEDYRTTYRPAVAEDAAWAWNEWEGMSLDVAESDGDEDLKKAIRDFWDQHIPALLSVKSGYAYFAIEKDTLSVVRGEEPEWEEPHPLAPSFFEILEMLTARDPRLDRWIQGPSDKMIATDSSTQKDVPTLCLSLGHELVARQTDGDHYWFYIRKGTGVSLA